MLLRVYQALKACISGFKSPNRDASFLSLAEKWKQPTHYRRLRIYICQSCCCWPVPESKLFFKSWDSLLLLPSMTFNSNLIKSPRGLSGRRSNPGPIAWIDLRKIATLLGGMLVHRKLPPASAFVGLLCRYLFIYVSWVRHCGIKVFCPITQHI